MAQQVTTSYVDDLDGSEASGTVSFGLDGKAYEIDLSDDNAARLRDALAEFVAAARRTRKDRHGDRRGRMDFAAPTSLTSAAAKREETQRIRQWASEQGLKVSDRGRIAKDIVAQYYVEHGPNAGPGTVRAPEFASAG